MRTITIEYVLSTEQVSVEYLSKKLGIYPSNTRSTFPKGSIAKPYWTTSISSTKSNIEEPLRELMEVVALKKDVINDITREWKVDSSVVIKVRADYPDRPELAIPPYQLCFFAEINAELLFDISYEW